MSDPHSDRKAPGPPRKHHYVPRVYFKPWEDKRRQVLVYERKNGIVLPPYWQSTKVICVEKDLYSYTDRVKDEYRYVIEKNLFSVVDDRVTKVLAKMIAEGSTKNITDEERVNFSVFLLSLRARTPEMVKGNAIQGEKEFREKLVLLEDDPELQQMKPFLKGDTIVGFAEKNYQGLIENKGRETLAKFIVGEEFYRPIYQMSWMVIPYPPVTPAPLLTSDRPLIVISKDGAPFYVGLPISPYHYFSACSSTDKLDQIIKHDRKKLAQQINISSIQQAKAKAFAKDTGHSMQFFKNRLGKHHSILPLTEYGN